MTAAAWTAHYEPGVPPVLPAPTPDAAFCGILKSAAAGAPGYRAIECYNRGTSFAELDALSERVATALERDGFAAGSVALVALPNGVHVAATSLGVMRSGGAAALLPHDAPDEALAHALSVTEPEVVFTTASRAAAAAQVLASSGGQLVVVRPESALPLSLRIIRRLGSPLPSRGVRGSRSAVRWDTWISPAADSSPLETGPDAPALVHLDPTTGASRCTYTHGHLISGAEQLRSWLTDALPGEDTWLLLDPLSAPLGFVAGLGTSVMLRSRLVLLPAWQPTDVLDALRYLRPTYVAASGEAMHRLYRAPDLRRADTRSVRAWIVGEPLARDVRRGFEDATGTSVCQGLGPACTAGLVACNPVNSRRVAGSVGLPLPGVEARIVGPGGAEVRTGEAGALELRGPNIAAEDGWLRTDVTARTDEAGFLYVEPDASREWP